MPTESESKNLYRQHLPNGSSFDLIHVKGGSYFFGDSDLEITLPDFCIGQYPVTQALWQVVMGDNPSHFKGQNRPVESISWYDAAAFCNALNSLIGNPPVYFRDKKLQEPLDYGMTRLLEIFQDISVFHNRHCPGFRIPSETEREFAARGGAKSGCFQYAGSGKLDEVGWYNENSHGETKPVGLKTPNELGIYDMSGNVLEWCADQWHDSIDLKNIPLDGSAWIDRDKDAKRVTRGDSWRFSAWLCRATNRSYDLPSDRYHSIGFRAVMFPPSVTWPVYSENT